MLDACPKGTKIYLYSRLARGARDPPSLLKKLGRYNLILLQDPKQMNSGHWTSLTLDGRRGLAYFFSSYGGKPDEEKVKWITHKQLKESGQLPNILNDLLKYLFLRGWAVYYNDFPYQIEGDDTASCGIWTSAFLNSGKNPDEFAAKHEPPSYYYKRLFH